MSSSLFPTFDHDHKLCSQNLMTYAEGHCKHLGLRFTHLRRDVLSEVAASHKAVGAYQILDRFASQGKKLAPISVYRSLDFLLDAGLIHRLESTNSYFACQRNFEKDSPCCSFEPLVFLICENCETIGEIDGQTLGPLIEQFVDQSGFAPKRSQLEIKGVCSLCQASGHQELEKTC